jgi:CheY-like chemotaxis protein
MFRILIVEDVKNTLRQLKIYISEALKEPDGAPSVVIHTAESVEDAKRLVLEAKEREQPYHAVVLDFKLPEQMGHKPELPDREDKSLCLLIRQKMSATLVAHITAYIADEVVRNHLRLVHQEQVNPRALVFSKAEGDYSIKLVERLRAFLYGMRIEEQMAHVFGEPQELAFAARGRVERARSRGGRSLTHDIAALRRDIVAHWHYLDEQLQNQIRQFFRVDDKSRPIRVSLRQAASQS